MPSLTTLALQRTGLPVADAETRGAAQALWQQHYTVRQNRDHVYPTEWVVRTLAGGRYPEMNLDPQRYPGTRILEASCGDGRNLGLLQDLGFRVAATEISPEIVDLLDARARRRGWNVEFNCGVNGAMPYADGSFDYLLAAASCYYLDQGTSFDAVLAEFARILKPGGYFVASIPDPQNFAAEGCSELPDGSVIVSRDPFGLRVGQRWMLARSRDWLQRTLALCFDDICIGHLDNDYFGLRVSGYIFVCRKRHAGGPRRILSSKT